MKKTELNQRIKNLLLAKFKVKLSSGGARDFVSLVLDFVETSKADLEKLGVELSFSETLSLLMREFYEEISATLRAEMTAQGISNDQVNKVVNWFSEMVYRVQIGGVL